MIRSVRARFPERVYAGPSRRDKGSTAAVWHRGGRRRPGALEANGEIGAVRLQPFLPELLHRLLAFRALSLTPDTAATLRRGSAATLKRLLAPIRAPRPLRGRGTTRAGTWLKHQIAVRAFAEWDDARPGFLEGDLVAHCGPTTLGFYLCTLCAVNIVTGRTELEAV